MNQIYWECVCICVQFSFEWVVLSWTIRRKHDDLSRIVLMAAELSSDENLWFVCVLWLMFSCWWAEQTDGIPVATGVPIDFSQTINMWCMKHWAQECVLSSCKLNSIYIFKSTQAHNFALIEQQGNAINTKFNCAFTWKIHTRTYGAIESNWHGDSFWACTSQAASNVNYAAGWENENSLLNFPRCLWHVFNIYDECLRTFPSWRMFEHLHGIM